MDSSRIQTSRDKLEAWLRYFDDLNLGEFYTDRRTMGKRSVEPCTRAAAAPASRASVPITAARAHATAALPIVQTPFTVKVHGEPSLFQAIERIEGDTLDRTREDLGDCTRCRLHKQRNKIVFGVGNPGADLVFVGEGPGHDEDVQGLPFVGRAGKLLTQMIEAMGLQRDDVYICNVVKCRPPENRKPEDDEVATCSPYLYRQLDVIAPKAIVCLGGVAAQTLLKTKDPISRFRGNWFDYRNTKLMATYHPAYLLRNPAAKSEVWKDLQKVMAHLGLQPRENLRSDLGLVAQASEPVWQLGLDSGCILRAGGCAMPNFYEYNPEQAYLLPPSVREVLGEGHLCFFVHRAVERLNLETFVKAYSEEGHPAYHPALMLKVWLYAYALGMTSSRRLEERIKEDLALRYLAGGARPDYWALNDFRRRHKGGVNEVFTQVVELARSLGMGKLGHVAIDSTRIAANAAGDSVDTEEKLRRERAKIRKQIRRWQQQCEAEDPNEGAGMEVAREVLEELERKLGEIPARLERLKKSGLKKRSRTDEDSRFLRQRQGYVLGYTGTVAVSEDYLIVGQQVSQAGADNELLVPMVERVEQECGERPEQVSADSGFFSQENLRAMEERGIDAYVPDSHLAHELNRGRRVRGHAAARDPAQQRMRHKLRSAAGRATYARRKQIVEPRIGTLKEQHGMRRFRLRGLAKTAVEFTLANTAVNLIRIWRRVPALVCAT